MKVRIRPLACTTIRPTAEEFNYEYGDPIRLEIVDYMLLGEVEYRYFDFLGG